MRMFFQYVIILGLFVTCQDISASQDRRCQFYDLSKIPQHKRVARSPLIQFYSSTDNIGNFLPVLGIQQMLGIETDVWCMHDKNIDFEFINKNYKGAIIGGAGLLNACFEPFWKKLDERCTLPMVMWGLGICLPYKHGDTAKGVDKRIVTSVARKCDLINIRDLLTAHYYNLTDADISPCPTVVYMHNFKPFIKPTNLVLYSAHDVSVGKEKTQTIVKSLKKAIPHLKIIDNIQRKDFGLEDYIKKYYCKSSLVITSRLHGAIMAYGLGLPCIMLPGDLKLDSFYETYGFGNWALTADACIALYHQGHMSNGIPLDIEPVIAFGKRVSTWLDDITTREAAP